MSHKIMRLPEVIEVTGLSRSTIYLRMAKGSFPLSISLGERAVGWLHTDIAHWLDARVAESKVCSHD